MRWPDMTDPTTSYSTLNWLSNSTTGSMKDARRNAVTTPDHSRETIRETSQTLERGTTATTQPSGDSNQAPWSSTPLSAKTGRTSNVTTAERKDTSQKNAAVIRNKTGSRFPKAHDRRT